MDDLIKAETESFQNYLADKKTLVFVVYILSGLVGIAYLLFQTFLFYYEFFIIYFKYFVLFNSLKVYNSLLYKKINTILVIFNDFTEENLNKIKISNNKKLLRSKFTLKGLLDELDLDLNLKEIAENYDLNTLGNLNQILNENAENLGNSVEQKIIISAVAESIFNLLNNEKEQSFLNAENNGGFLQKNSNNLLGNNFNNNFMPTFFSNNLKNQLNSSNNNNYSNSENNYFNSNNSYINKNLATSNQLMRKKSSIYITQLSHISSLNTEEVNLNSTQVDSKNYNNRFSNVLSNVFNKYQKKNKLRKAAGSLKKSMLMNKKTFQNDVIFEKNEEIKYDVSVNSLNEKKIKKIKNDFDYFTESIEPKYTINNKSNQSDDKLEAKK